MLDPAKVVCIVKHNGKEIGRIKADDPRASDYIDNLATTHGGCTVDYEEIDNETADGYDLARSILGR